MDAIYFALAGSVLFVSLIAFFNWRNQSRRMVQEQMSGLFVDEEGLKEFNQLF